VQGQLEGEQLAAAAGGGVGEREALAGDGIGSTLAAPWSLRIRDEAPLTVVAMVRGDAWIVHDGREPVALRTGDVAVVRGPEHYTVADDPATAPQVAVDPGQEAVLDRLLDLLLIAVLRAWCARPDSGAPEWYRAYGEVAELADETGASRAALARRFNELVGEPPMAFLTSWRIALAADLLLEPGATIGSVAAEAPTISA
jgi:AraC-like DNA-binding protein